MRVVPTILCCLFFTAPAFADKAAVPPPPSGRIKGKVTVTEADGKPAPGADIIVYILAPNFSEPGGNATEKIAQKGRKFVPDLVAVTKDDSVEFPNEDPFLHNVFSQSPPRKFDLGSFKKGESKKKQFDQTGVVDVYCNIHPEMAATILVLPNKKHVRADAQGRYVLEGVPAGNVTVFAYTRRATKPVSSQVTVTANGEVTVDLALQRGAEAPHKNKFGENYHGPGGSYPK
jgi:plastocyanin